MKSRRSMPTQGRFSKYLGFSMRKAAAVLACLLMLATGCRGAMLDWDSLLAYYAVVGTGLLVGGSLVAVIVVTWRKLRRRKNKG